MDNFIINVNSEFSDQTKYSTSNFVYHLDEEIKNIIYIKVGSIELPTTNYQFLSTKANISFVIGSSSSSNATVTIEEGNYTPSTLVTKIENKLTTINSSLGTNLEISLDDVSNKITFTNNSNLYLNFENTDVGYGSLGAHLGFTENTYYYTGTQTYTAENVINLDAPKYYFLKINEIDNIQDYYVKNAFAKILKTSGDFDYSIEGYGDYTTKAKVFRNPINLNRLEIQLVDYRDNIIDLNGAHLSFTLEVGYVYDKKLYEEISNKGIPSGDTRTKFFF